MNHLEQSKKKHKKRVLFICKKRHIYGEEETGKKILKSSGLYNSAKFVSDMLNNNDVESKIVDVIDNNSIDKEVSLYKPTHVIIEALWVVPEKFDVLTKLHPKIKWIIRLHSEIPFLSNEGIAMDWIYKYVKYKNVHIGANSTDAVAILEKLLKNEKVFYLPNYYPITDPKCDKSCRNKNIVHVGCFGAIRPMKNQLAQAIAAIQFANTIGRSLHFHINTERIEGRGEPILNNIRALFKNNPKHKLVEYPWLDHKEFVKIVKRMDIGMQVSFSETFNIVTADFVANDVAVVVSSEVSWASDFFKADPNSNDDMIKKLLFVWRSKILKLKLLNLLGLKKYNKESTKVWLEYFK